MTVAEAISKIRQIGTVESVSGKLRIRIPASLEAVLQRTIEALREGKAEAIALLTAKQPLLNARPDPEELSWATTVFAQNGVRLIELNGQLHIGVWSDLDCPVLRAAIAVFHSEGVPVIYLDSELIPLRYKLRHIEGEPVPTHVREVMERSPEPWKVRNRSKWRFVPWPQTEAKAYTADPRTGIRPMAEWVASCGRGFVRPDSQLTRPAAEPLEKKRNNEWQSLQKLEPPSRLPQQVLMPLSVST
jgi:hypothetical protein